jgi:hypothetical protein
MSKQPEALVLAELLEGGPRRAGDGAIAAELRRLHEENEALKKAYRKMRNAAAGYSNYCDDSASVRRCERDMDEAESMYRAAIGNDIRARSNK